MPIFLCLGKALEKPYSKRWNFSLLPSDDSKVSGRR